MKIELRIAYPKGHDEPSATAVMFEESETDEPVAISKKLLGPILAAMLKLEESGEEAFGHVALKMSLEYECR